MITIFTIIVVAAVVVVNRTHYQKLNNHNKTQLYSGWQKEGFPIGTCPIYFILDLSIPFSLASSKLISSMEN